VLTIIESGSQAWALATANGDLRIFSRDGAGEWSEAFLTDDTEQLDESGSLILEALYEQQVPIDAGEVDEEPELEQEDPEAEEDVAELEDDEEPEPAEEEPEEEEAEAEEEEEEEKPRRRTKSTSRKK
jgi:hypothetical protein